MVVAPNWVVTSFLRFAIILDAETAMRQSPPRIPPADLEGDVWAGSPRSRLAFDCGVHGSSEEERQPEVEAVRVFAANIVESSEIVLEQHACVRHVERDVSRGAHWD